MLEWLLNYPLTTWQDATLVFASGWSRYLLLALVAMASVVIAALLSGKALRTGRKITLFVLQSISCAVLLLMLWQPALQVQVSSPGENTIAWVLDSSASMGNADIPVDGQLQSRRVAGAALVEEAAANSDSEFGASLYHLGNELAVLDNVEELTSVPASSRSNLAAGLDALLGTVNERALAAVVLLSDGSDNSNRIDTQWWQRLSAAGVPIHTVGMGPISKAGDLQLSDVALAGSAPPNTRTTARLRISHDRDGPARIRVFADQDLIAAQDIDLPAGVNQSVHEVNFPVGERGIRQLMFDVQADTIATAGVGADTNLANNRQPRVMRVDESPKRILYVEGEPRWEYKFLRRALENHEAIELVSLLRTSPNKFYRQGVRDAQELAEGFPLDRESLFSYDAIIIGSFEAVELSTEQQVALRDFVSVRGGSLLMLGGRHGLADGGWGRSVVAPALPVALSSKLKADTFDRTRMQVLPTLSGFRTPWLQLENTVADNEQAWETLPMVADRQALGVVKPGAVVLLAQQPSLDDNDAAEPLLVLQRYGRGQSVVLGTSGTWRWQMGLSSEDQRHETFWRQLAGMLVDPVILRLKAETSHAVYRDNDVASVNVTAFNPDFTPLVQSRLPIKVTRPDGTVSTVSLEADAKKPGFYRGEVPTELNGPYSMTALTSEGGEASPIQIASLEQWWVRESGTAESFNATQQVDFLQRVAEATGGQYLDYADADRLFDALSTNNAALKRDQQLALWNMPLFFLIVLLVKLIEWLLRLRWKRL